MALQSDSRTGQSATAVAAVPPSFWSTLRIPPAFFYYLLAVFCVILVLSPVGVLLLASVFKGQPGMLGEFTLGGYKTWLGALDLIPIFTNSVIFASSRLAISLTFALLFAWAVARTDVPFRRTMTLLIPIPFFTPDLLTGISWLMLGNPQNGLINQFATALFGFKEPVINLYGWFGLIFHSSQSSISFMFLMLVAFFYNMDSSYEEASVTLGATKYKTVFNITLPMLSPAILSISILVFASGLDSFENPLLFGNPGGVYVFANEIYRMIHYRFPARYNDATALSVILIAITFSLIVLQWMKLGARSYSVISGKGYRPNRIRLPNGVKWTIVGIFAIYFLLSIVIPLAQIIAASFFKIFGMYRLEHLTLENWTNVFRDDLAANGIKNTIIFSSAAAFATVIIGGLIGWIRVRTRHWLGRALELLAWTPWTLPGIVLGLALLWAWALPPPPFNLYGTAWVIILGFVVKGMPLGTSTMQAAIHQVSGELEESSRVHGGSWLRTMRLITAPLLRKGVFAAFVIVFALAARDLTIPLLLYRGGTETLTVAMLLYYEEGNLTTLSVVAVLQLGLIFGLLGLERLTRARDARDE
ncbi:MAG: iron ABC transporter permease [Alphaproteobacteria bacterium]|nr:iron ABC transporter permease [Alphaproteobacteria bacterium]